MVDRTSPYALGQFLHERFSAAQTWDYYHRFCMMANAAWGTVKPYMPTDIPYSVVSPSQWHLSSIKSATGTLVTLAAGDTAGLAKAITLEFSFPAGSKAVDVTWLVQDKDPSTYPEGGWLCFPFVEKTPRFTVGRLGGAMDPAKDLVVGANRHLFGVHTGVAVTGPDGNGSALCSPDAPTMSLGVPGLWKYTYDYLPKDGAVFVHLYNNMWNTNFPLWIEGTWRCRVRLWPVDKGTGVAEDLAVRSMETRIPLLAGRATGEKGTLPAAQAGVRVSRKGVAVTAFGVNPDGRGTLLRLWEEAGVSGRLTVNLPPGTKFATATPGNLRGEKTGEPVQIWFGRLKFDLHAYAPVSFLLLPRDTKE